MEGSPFDSHSCNVALLHYIVPLVPHMRHLERSRATRRESQWPEKPRRNHVRS